MLKVTPTAAPHYSLAHQQHRYSRLLGSLEVEHADRQGPVLRDLELRMTANPAVFEPHVWRIAELGPGAIVQLRDGQPEPGLESLEALGDEQQLRLRFELRHEGREAAAATAEALLLPKDHWAGARGMPELLASFVQPHAELVERLVKRAAGLLREAPGGYALDGYQSGDRRAPWMTAQALWQAVAELGLDYVAPPPDFARAGQRIRLPERVASSGAAACLDASVLFAACLEAAGLHPVVALTDGHACAGCWLVEDSFPLLANEDPMDMRKRVDGQDIVLFETTLALRPPVPSFAAACAAAEPLLAEAAEAAFVLALDVKQARERGVRPLPDRRELAAAAPVAGETAAPPPMEAPPAMPPVRAEEKPPAATPAGRVDGWQRRLLDLTKRNRMLNFGGRASHLRLYCPDVHHMEDVLAQNRRFKFIAMEDTGFGDLAAGGGAPLADEKFREYAEAQLAKQTLVAAGEAKRMEATLLALYRKAKNDLEEGGSNTLFMSLGMLRWREVPSSRKTHSAPLVMLPLQLHRSSARARISASIHPDEEPVFNATLIEFLQQDHEIDLGHFREQLPSDGHGVDVAAVWAAVRAAVKEAPGFELAESVVVSNFSFSKFLMWRDLTERLDMLKENIFVNHLIESGGGGGYPHAAEVIDPRELDRCVVPGGLHVPLNADSSQLAAVEASTKEQDFILEGPPGTGKSETIANIVAANVARGRKVLFVAEKMEALKVVARRLDGIGLGPRCLELHSSKANKKAVLAQLRAAWGGYVSPLAAWDEEHGKLAADRDALNRYLAELHGPGELCDISPWESMGAALGEGDAFDLGLAADPALVPAAAKSWLKELQEQTERLLDVWDEIRDWDPRAVALAGSGEWSNRWEADFRAAAAKAEASNARVLEVAAGFGVPALSNRPRTLAAGLALAEPARLLLVFGPEAAARRAELAEIIERVGHRRKVHEELGADPDFDVVRDLPVLTWQAGLKQAGPVGRFFRRLLIRRFLAKRGLRLAASDAELAALSESKAETETLEKLLTPFIDSGIWPGWHQANIGELRGLLQRCEALAADAAAGDVAAAFSGLAPDPARLAELEQALASCETDERAWRDLGAAIPADRAELAALLPALGRIGRLEYCLDWNRLRAASCGDYPLAPVADAVAAGQLRREGFKEALSRAFHRWLAPLLIDASPALRRFRVRDHERLRTQFADRDRMLADATGQQVAALAAARVPPREGRLSEGLKLLNRELNKKQRHVPIRKLMEALGAEVLDLTPCMMMSPISIAQFLPRDFNHFDLVVFDEASQITVWDAVGTIARGRNVIVVGDPKQMPPTNFFSRSATDAEDDEQDYESILDRALDAGLKKHRLTGHYRSRHESLIAFSNSKYYENSLATYPAAVTKESAVEFHRVDGLYSKGKEANNPKEAQHVAAEVLRRLTDPALSKLSIGVVALNQSQQRTIENQLDDLRRARPEIEPFFSDEDGRLPLFVKNLETVQGDERDVIILSLGYGPTEPGAASMSMNFGPLNRAGGERRLNVAITRARHEVLVFASMDYRLIDLSRTQARAVADLRDYLEYAERGVSVLAGQTEARYGVDSFDSDFERDVAFWLRDRGWQVQSQVGVSRFRVDLGVVDPDRPGVYLAGVECDGATYHGSPAARDRDRIRQQVLEGLGWRFVRIWSTDYFRDPERTMQEVDARLRELRAAGPAAEA